jgi:hypothetical protein
MDLISFRNSTSPSATTFSSIWWILSRLRKSMGISLLMSNVWKLINLLLIYPLVVQILLPNVGFPVEDVEVVSTIPTNTSYGRNFRGRGRGRGPLNSFNTTKPICQICHKPGHEDSDCYRRFDNSSPHDSITLMQPQAHYASQQAPLDQAWYSDSGATHHLTPDLTNLTINAADYIGSDQIRMGNGNGLAIEHIRDTQLTSPTTSFLLRNVLHVPLITKNLLSVHKFTIETNTYIEFHPWFFLVNEQGLGKILLQRLND